METVKLICSQEVYNFLTGRGANMNGEEIKFERVIEELDGKEYMVAKDELEAEHLLDTKLSCLYAERNFLAGQSQFISNLLKTNRTLLTTPKYKGDLAIMADVRKMENDIPILMDAYNFVNAALFKHIEAKYGQGKKLLYCKTEV